VAVTKRRPRRVKKTTTPVNTKGESWQIVGPDGAIIRDTSYGEGATLAMAQTLAQKYDEEVELTVRWKALFGEPDTLYRVVREEDGSITTWRT
jgi:hypothetical protein